MATKKEPEKKPAKKPEKVKPTPVPCTCGRLPVVSKIKGGAYFVGCPHWKDCDNTATSGRWPTEEKAIEMWNLAIKNLPYTRRAKK